MPVYDYDCAACGRRVEVIHGVNAPGPTHCPNCGGGPLRKAISAPAVHFKGSGWAKRDRRATATPGTSKASKDAAAADGHAAGDSEAKDRGGTSDGSKPAGEADKGSAGGGDDGKKERPAVPTTSTGAGSATRRD